MPKKIKLNDKDCAYILNRYNQLISLQELSAELSCSRTIITAAIIRAGGTIRGRGRLSSSKTVAPVLLEKLEILSSLLSTPSLNDDVQSLIVRYIMKFNDGRTFGKIDRQYAYSGLLSQFRKDHLEANYYIMGRLWRAVYSSVTYKNIKLADFGVSAKDVDFCISKLSKEDKLRIKKWVIGHTYIQTPNEVGVHSVVRECEKTINSVVNSKLRFSYQYDPCYDKEDLVSYLRSVAYKVALKYDWEVHEGKFAFEKCLNFTRRSLWNAAYLLIKQNTSSDYNRITKVDSDQRVYQITTISLESNAEDEEGFLDLQDRIGVPADTSVEVEDLVASLRGNFPAVGRFLSLEFEDIPAFSEFVLKETGVDENSLYIDDFEMWRKLAMQFSGLDDPQNSAAKRQTLLELGLTDQSEDYTQLEVKRNE